MGPRLELRDALLLGVLQGPTELLPVSSSAHTALIPWLLGWSSASLDAEARNALEVALHAGTAAALMLDVRRIIGVQRRDARQREAGCERSCFAVPGPRSSVTALLALAPPALVGYVFERRLEWRPSGPRALAGGLALGGLALALADRRPQTRELGEAGPGDGLALGLAQGAALLPGVSRNGATLAAARARGFAREDAQALSWRAGLPVIVGAAALKGLRLAGRGAPTGARKALALAAAAAFVSTLAGGSLIRPGRRERELLPFALYRVGLAVLVTHTARRRRAAS
jgi:undecaprenyl-diphosphatase